MKLTNSYQLPESIVRAIQLDDYDGNTPDPWNISTSKLIAPLRKALLEDRHDSELIEDVSDNIWRLFGNSMHYVLSKQGDTCITEKRISAFVNDFTVTGKPDNYDPKTYTLLDYKVTSAWTFVFSQKEGKREWTEQMNVYIWLLRKNGFRVDSCRIIAILRDWQEREAQKSLDYPQVAIQQIDIPIWTDYEQDEFIWNKLDERKKYKDLPDDRLPLCSDAERWKTPDTYAFVKDRFAAKAVRVFKDELEAEKFANENPKLEMIIRKGEDRRCMRYCGVAKFCSYYKENYEEQPKIKEAV
jgi:hypothetical protein